MSKIYIYLIFIFELFICANVFANESIITNLPLWREVSGWEENIKDRNSKHVISDIDATMSAEVVPWRIAVIQGKDWSYQWGFFAWYMKAWAEQATGKNIDSYSSLVKATAYLPEKAPSTMPYYYWRWHIAMGDVCDRIGRKNDAVWYYDLVYQNLTTNDGLYFRAISSLARIYGRLGEYKKANKLYKTLFSFHPKQRARDYNNYIRFLFACGDFEKGVLMIKRAAKLNGFSSKKVERDFLIKDACRYWHFFNELDIIDWYEIIGNQLDKIKLKKGNEDLIALLINTRKMIFKTYPDLFNKTVDDMKNLRKRIERESKEKITYKSKRNIFKKNKNNFKKKNIQKVITYYSDDYTNNLIEKEINYALNEAQKMIGYNRGRIKDWRKILDKYTTNQLMEVTVDNVSALFLSYSRMGVIYWDTHKNNDAEMWLKKALELPSGTRNSYRFNEILLCLAETYLRKNDIDNAEYYLKWADDLIGENVIQYVQARTELAGIILKKEGIKARIKILQELVKNYGCTPRQCVYERLARDYYRLNEKDAGFNILIEGIKRLPLKMSQGRFNHLIAAIIANKSFHTSEQLKEFKEIIKSSALRKPAVIKNAPVIARLFSLADEPWIDEHIKLAEIEENNNYSDENRLFISNTVFKSPSIRAGLLYMKAQAARDETGTNYYDWSGWIKGFNVAEEECKSKYVPIDSGVKNLKYQYFFELLNKYKKNISPNDKRKVIFAITLKIKQFSDYWFEYLTDNMGGSIGADNLAALYFSKIDTIKHIKYDDKYLTEILKIYNKLSKNMKVAFIDILNKVRKKSDDSDKLLWEQLIEKCKKKLTPAEKEAGQPVFLSTDKGISSW